jgi:hypothetical protein
MLAIPLSVAVQGPVDAVRAFLARIQTGLQRQLLVTTLSVAALEESAGDGARPASEAGDVRATAGALAWVLPVEADAAGGAGDVPAGTGPAAGGGLPQPSGAGAFAAPASTGSSAGGSAPATATAPVPTAPVPAAAPVPAPETPAVTDPAAAAAAGATVVDPSTGGTAPAATLGASGG